MMFDPFEPLPGRAGITLSGMIDDWVPITPNDSADNVLDRNSVAQIGVALRCNTTAGNVTFLTRHGTSRTIAMAVGEVLSVSVQRVMATGTTAVGVQAGLPPS